MSSADSPRPGLPDLVVVEVAGSAAGGYAGRLLAGWGARVILAEPPGGTVLRADEGLFAYLMAGKESVEVDQDSLAELVGAADIVIESSSPEPLLPRTIDRPGLVRLELSPYGSSGPAHGRWSTDLTDQAISGHLLLNGDPEREPIQGPAHQAAYAAGLHGCIGVLASTLAGHEGHTIEVSHHEVMTSLHQFTLIRWRNGGDLLNRMGNRWAGPGRACGLYRCRDGFLALIVPRDDQLERMLSVTGLVELLAEPGIEHAYDLMHHPTLLDGHLRPWFAAHDVADVVARLQEVRVAAGPVADLDAVLADPHLAARDWWQSSPRPEAAEPALRYPGPPARVDGVDWRVTSAPALGDHGELSVAAPRVAASRSDQIRPLDGLRVIDLSRVWAGPLATRILADLGADVVMVEAPWARGGQTIDEASVRATGYYPDNDPGAEHWNRIGFVNKYSLGKKSVSLDLGAAGAKEALAALVRSADVVIENFSPRVMPQLGFDEDHLRKLNPHLVYVTMPGYGRTGPDANRVAYGPIIDSHAGLSVLMGYPGEPARKAGVAWPDPVAGLHAVVGALVALLARRTDSTRRGRTIEVAQLEACVSMVGHALLERQLTGRRPEALGNRHDQWAPHGVYPCCGDDRWVAIAVVNDEGWEELCRRADLGDLAGLDRRERQQQQAAVDRRLAAWTTSRTQVDVVAELAVPGVAVAVVADAQQVSDDPHLAERRSFVSVDHPDAGLEVWPRTPIRFGGEVLAPRRPAPRLGADNRRVLVEEVGLDPAVHDDLLARGGLTTRPPE